jgi:ArsR family transcriptional regulator
MTKQPAPDLDQVIKALAHPLRREILGWLKDPKKSFSTQAHSFELGVCAGKIFEKVGQWIFYSRNEVLIEKFLDRIKSEL